MPATLFTGTGTRLAPRRGGGHETDSSAVVPIAPSVAANAARDGGACPEGLARLGGGAGVDSSRGCRSL